jgi:hypothetical protein
MHFKVLCVLCLYAFYAFYAFRALHAFYPFQALYAWGGTGVLPEFHRQIHRLSKDSRTIPGHGHGHGHDSMMITVTVTDTGMRCYNKYPVTVTVTVTVVTGYSFDLRAVSQPPMSSECGPLLSINVGEEGRRSTR